MMTRTEVWSCVDAQDWVGREKNTPVFRQRTGTGGGRGLLIALGFFFWSVSISKVLGSSHSRPLPFLIFSPGHLKITHYFGGPREMAQAGLFGQKPCWVFPGPWLHGCATPHWSSVLCIFTSCCCFLQRFTLRPRWVQSSPSTSYLAAYLFNPGSFPCVLVG